MVQFQNVERAVRIREQMEQMAAREEAGSTDDRNEGEGGQEPTVQQLTAELHNIMETINSRPTLIDDFVGLEEAIQATLQVAKSLFLTTLIITCQPTVPLSIRLFIDSRI